jgi:hypothetical protein
MWFLPKRFNVVIRWPTVAARMSSKPTASSSASGVITSATQSSS